MVLYEDPIGLILQHEGGYTAHPNDRGNYYKGKLVGTNLGITGETLARYLNRDVTADDVKILTEDTAREIYEREYLTGPRINTLPEPPRTLLLDMSINHGPRNAIRMMQKVINMAGFGPIGVDGVIGPKTRGAAEQAAAAMGNYFQNAIVEERIKLYNKIVERNESQGVFLRGWLRRAESFKLPV